MYYMTDNVIKNMFNPDFELCKLCRTELEKMGVKEAELEDLMAANSEIKDMIQLSITNIRNFFRTYVVPSHDLIFEKTIYADKESAFLRIYNYEDYVSRDPARQKNAEKEPFPIPYEVFTDKAMLEQWIAETEYGVYMFRDAFKTDKYQIDNVEIDSAFTFTEGVLKGKQYYLFNYDVDEDKYNGPQKPSVEGNIFAFKQIPKEMQDVFMNEDSKGWRRHYNLPLLPYEESEAAS